MGTLLGVVDFVALVLLLTRVLRAFWKQLPKGTGSLILVILAACPLVAFLIVSLTVYVGLIVQFPTLLGRAIPLFFLLGMFALLRVTWDGQPDGVS